VIIDSIATIVAAYLFALAVFSLGLLVLAREVVTKK
jgi:hypothetical protein